MKSKHNISNERTIDLLKEGQALFGMPINIPATFDKKAIIQDNTGRLDFDHEEEQVRSKGSLSE